MSRDVITEVINSTSEILEFLSSKGRTYGSICAIKAVIDISWELATDNEEKEKLFKEVKEIIENNIDLTCMSVKK